MDVKKIGLEDVMWIHLVKGSVRYEFCEHGNEHLYSIKL
jgi:hypothetical protein